MQNTISAAANKVTSITSSPAQPRIGETIEVVVNGQTGTASGAIWVSPAAYSAWPTKALRLEASKLEVSVNGDGVYNQTYLNNLYIPGSIASLYSSKTIYRATYTFRVAAATTTNPTVQPVANISSGAQFKYTGSYPTLPTVNIANATSSTTVSKQLATTDLTSLPTTTSPNGIAGATTYTEVPYRVTLSTDSIISQVDEVVDVHSGDMFFKNGSATLTQGGTTGSIPDPSISATDTGNMAGAYHFIGPFSPSAGDPVVLTYVMYVPVTSGVYNNQAMGNINQTTFGSSATTCTTVSVTSDGTQLSSSNNWSGSCGSLATAKDQTITFPAVSDTSLTTPTVNLSATASSNLPVTYTSQTPSVCTVSGATVTVVAAGTCTVTASQAGDSSYKAAPDVTQSFQVTKAAQRISFTQPSDIPVSAGTVTLAATTDSGLPVTYTSQTPSVCTVSGASVTVVAAGTCTVTASQAGDGTYAAATDVTHSFQATQGNQTITFPQPENIVITDKTTMVAAQASSGLPVSYSTSTPDICSIAGDVVTVLATGTCTITASQIGDKAYTAATPVTQSFDVIKASQVITFPQPSNMSFAAGGTTFAATTDSGLPVSYTSKTSEVCTVSSDGSVSFVAGGTCTVTASQAGDSTFDAAAEVEKSFTVLPAKQAITFPPVVDTITTSAPISLTATASSDLPVTYTSLTPAVCSISEDGVHVIANAPGTCTVQAAQAGDVSYTAAATVTDSFVISKAPQDIVFQAPANTSVDEGTVALTGESNSGLPVTYTSLTPRTCSIDGSTVKLLGPGTCTITAAQAGNETYAAAPSVTDSFAVAPRSALPPEQPVTSVGAGAGQQQVTVPVPAGGDIAFTGTGSGTDPGTDPGAGTETNPGTGGSDNTVTVPGQGTYQLDPATGNITFIPAPGFIGTATPIAFTVTDPHGNTVTQGTYTATVEAIAAKEVVSSAPQGATQNLTPLLATDKATLLPESLRLLDATGKPVTDLVIPGVGSFAADPATGQVAFTPVSTFTGTRDVTYRVTDSDGSVAEAVMTVSVSPLKISGGWQTIRDGQTGTIKLGPVPDGAQVSVPTTVSGAVSVKFVDGAVVVVPRPGFTGKILVPVTVKSGTTTLTTTVVVTVLPAAPISPVYNLLPGGRTAITWTLPAKSQNAYEVRINGKVVCRVAARKPGSCVVKGLIGPGSTVQIQAIGARNLRSALVRATYRSRGCVAVSMIHFATDSSKLNSTSVRTLRSLGGTVRQQRFGRVCLVGHTDWVAGDRYNLALSKRRVVSTKSFFAPLTPKVRYSLAYRGERSPLALNTTVRGKAANRRVSIAIT